MSRLIKVWAPRREEYERNRIPFVPEPEPFQHPPSCSPSRTDPLQEQYSNTHECSKYPVGERTYVGRRREQLTVQQQVRHLPDSSYIEVSEDGVNWFVIENSEARR